MNSFKNILCLVSAEDEGNIDLDLAVKLANKNHANLSVVVVLEEMPLDLKLIDIFVSSKDIQANTIATHKKRLEKLVSPFIKDIDIQTKVLVGIPFIETTREVLRNRHDIVIKTAERDGILNSMFGSNDMHLLRKCPCPLWLVKPKSPNTFKRIIAAVDVDNSYLSEELKTRHLLNHQVLEVACSLALSESAELHIVHAWDAFGDSANRYGYYTPEDNYDIFIEEVNAYVQEVRQTHSHNMITLMDELANKVGRDTLDHIKPQTHLLNGSPKTNVPEFALKINAELVVMGTVARTGLPGFFIGNTAESILGKLDCSVFAVKPEGFKTPVTLED